MLIDTHSHLYDKSFSGDWKEVLDRIREAHVEKIFLPNVDLESVDSMHRLADENPGLFYPMMGLHPCSVKEDYLEVLEQLENYLGSRTYSAIGEIGLDLYWDKTFFDQQKWAFIIQCEWANAQKLPIVIHSRESTAELIELLVNHVKVDRTGIFHCFSGTEDEARKIIDLGYYLGIGGVLTFKNSNLPEVVKAVGLDRIVLETDSPYLAPMPFRGKRNESSYVKLVAEKLATIFQTSLLEIEEITTRNALKIFSPA